MKEIEFRETKGFCRLCETSTSGKAVIIPFRYAGKTAPIILCCDCVKELARKVDALTKPAKRPLFEDDAPNTWADITGPKSLALYLELEHNVEPAYRIVREGYWACIYNYEGETYRSSLDLAGNWTLEVLK